MKDILCVNLNLQEKQSVIFMYDRMSFNKY
jgi:hypothetical protein